MLNKKYTAWIVIFAVILKLALFAFASIHAPQSKFSPDTSEYLKTAAVLASKGVMAIETAPGILTYEVCRTPGYPLLLAGLHHILKIPLNGVLLIQLAMTLIAAFITYKAACQIDKKIAFLSAVIILFDPPITIFSLMLLTEALFLFLISAFMLSFTLYLKNRKFLQLVLTAFILVSAVYVRPIGYYLGGAIAVFIIYALGRENLKRAVIHALVFAAIVYSFLGVWQLRNYSHCYRFAFSDIERSNLSCQGLAGSYVRNEDPQTKGMAPLPYYINTTTRCFMSLMTRQGSLKYFRSDILTAAGKIIFYPWMLFWLTGFIFGLFKVGRNIYYQFMLIVILYLAATSIGGVMWHVGERFRVPMMPFISIISASGWVNIVSYTGKKWWARQGSNL